MSNQPNSSFPLLASDQAEVIQIFLELMSEGDRAASAPEVKSDRIVGPRDGSGASWFPRELHETE